MTAQTYSQRTVAADCSSVACSNPLQHEASSCPCIRGSGGVRSSLRKDPSIILPIVRSLREAEGTDQSGRKRGGRVCICISNKRFNGIKTMRRDLQRCSHPNQHQHQGGFSKGHFNHWTLHAVLLSSVVSIFLTCSVLGSILLQQKQTHQHHTFCLPPTSQP